jgi:hypothetical protein
VGSAAEPIAEPDWPGYSTVRLDELAGRFEHRFVKLGRFLIDVYARGFAVKRVLRFGLRSQKRNALGWFRSSIEKNIKSYGIVWEDRPKQNSKSLVFAVGGVALAAGAIWLLARMGFLGL